MKSDSIRTGLTREAANKYVTHRKWLFLVAVALITLPSTALVNAQGILYIVNTISDTVVIGACQNGNPGCSLRGAIQTANSHVGADGIVFDLPAGSVINLTGALPNISEGVSILGPGASALTVQRSTVSGTPQFRIFTVTTTGPVTFSGLTISNGSAQANSFSDHDGGGINNNNTGTVNITNCVLAGNSSSAGNGGGVFNGANGTVNVTGSTLSGNSVAESVNNGGSNGFGGGVCNVGTGTVNVTNSTLSSNSATDQGGGIFYNSTGGSVNVTNSTLSDNFALGGGGGISSGGILKVTNSTLSSNHTSSSDGIGGGILNAGTASVTSSTLSGNSAFIGGGILNLGSGTMNVTNSTLSGNSTSGSSGGGIDNENTATVNLTNSTLSGNFAMNGSGGGISNAPQGSANVKSSIIALNTATISGPDVFNSSGNALSQGFNLIGKNDGASASFPAGNPNANNDIVGTSAAPVNPGLDPNGLMNNGGPTRTIALLPGSPAIDKGTSNGLTGNLTTDQRGTGFLRTFDYPFVTNATGGNGTDIGAFELLTPYGVSRKAHGATNFDIDLPLTGTAGIECRAGGANGDHQVIVTFPSTVSLTSANVTTGTGSVSSSSVNGAQVTVNLTGVANAQTIVITLFGVDNGTNTTNVNIPMGVLLGDTTGNGSVNSTDVSQTKGQSGNAAIAGNFRTDINLNGAITSSDVSAVKSKSGTALP